MHRFGGFKTQGRDFSSAQQIIADAKALEEAGAFAILLEAIPDRVAKIITERAHIPIIGIGAGPWCDGQLLIVHDLVGFFDKFQPRFSKKYCDLNKIIGEALGAVQGRGGERRLPRPRALLHHQGRGAGQDQVGHGGRGSRGGAETRRGVRGRGSQREARSHTEPQGTGGYRVGFASRPFVRLGDLCG